MSKHKQPTNDKEYFADPRLSQSALKDFIKCSTYYKAKHIDKIIPNEQTDALTVGSALDCWITENKMTFERTYEVMEPKKKRCKKTDPSYPYQLTDGMYNTVEGMASRINSQPIMEKLFGKCDTQTILTTKTRKAKLDYFYAHGPTGIIADLKSTADISKLKYSVRDFGYYLQMAYYRSLAKLTYPKVKNWRCYLVVVDKTKNYQFGVWKFDPDMLDYEQREISNWYKRLQAFRVEGQSNEAHNKTVCRICPPVLHCPRSIITMDNIEEL